MADLVIEGPCRLQGRFCPPPDKSISHRAALIGSLAQGVTRIQGYLFSQDCIRTLHCLQELGIPVEIEGESVVVHGRGLWRLLHPASTLDVGNAGTLFRLILGILAAQPFAAAVDGDESIRRRPMDRVAIPLRAMGAKVEGVGDRCFPPVGIQGGRLVPMGYSSPVASAQVKSAILLAGAHAEGRTTVDEPARSRDHTERMLRAFGAEIEVNGPQVGILGPVRLEAQEVMVPGDFSSACFFLAAAAASEGSELTIEKVGLNPTRTGLLDVLGEMGAEIEVGNVRTVAGEPAGDIRVRGASLRATAVGGDMIPRIIDEVPVLAVVAAVAHGETVIRDAGELRVKESDRLASTAEELRKLGARVEEEPDGLRIHGPTRMAGARVESHGDHRIAMAGAVAGILAEGRTIVSGSEWIETSFPGFKELLRQLVHSAR